LFVLIIAPNDLTLNVHEVDRFIHQLCPHFNGEVFWDILWKVVPYEGVALLKFIFTRFSVDSGKF